MDYLSVFLLSFTIALSGALAPGPLLATVIAGSLEKGFKTGPTVISGHALLELVMVAILVLGLGQLINTPGVIKTISLIGAAILILSGIAMIFSAPSASLQGIKKETSTKNLFLQGITMSIANPYWAVWWVTIGLGLLLSARKSGIAGLMFFFTGHILADFGWYSFVSFSLSRGKRFISMRSYRTILFMCAALIILFGIYFGITALV